MKNIFAYTATDYKEYPAYISVNKKDDGAIWVTVRSKDSHEKVAEIELAPEMLENFCHECLAELGEP